MSKKQYILKPIPNCEPEIGLMLGMLDDARQRSLDVIDSINAEAIDWLSPHYPHTIGTLLYHIVAIEIDWFAVEVMEDSVDKSIWDWFPHEVRDELGRLTIVTNEALDHHLERLKIVRALVIEGFKAMTLDEFYRLRKLDDYDVTPRWVLHHLCQHEAEHRNELIALKNGYNKSLSEK